MEDKLQVLQRNALFGGIGPEDAAALLGCLCAYTREYGKQETILRMGEPAGEVGLVCRGSVQVLQEDFMGNRTILSSLGVSELFGEVFACAGVRSLPVSVVSVTDSSVLLFDYRKIITTCSRSCEFHNRLVENMLGILAQKNMVLNRKIEILSRRTTREKLIAFFTAQAQEAGGRSFTLPFNRQELADYLCVERSAMTTELSRMRRDGLVEFEKNHFTLLELEE